MVFNCSSRLIFKVMKKILLINLIASLFISICIANSARNIAFYNFSNAKIDANNQISNELSEKIQDNFIDIMKDDFKSIPNIYFIPTKSLDKEMSNVKKSLLRKIRSNLKTDIITIATPQKLENIIKSVSKNRLSDGQINLITDSLVISISKMTKDIAKDMILSNIIEINQPSEITMRDFYNFINSTTEKSISKSTLSNFITSSSKNFEVDAIVTGKYEINEKQIKVDFYVYDYKTLNFIGKISAESSIDKAHILIKDLEFKLLNKLSTPLLDNRMKAELCKYNVDNFSKSDNSLYLSKSFSTEDIKELKIRFQIDEDFNLINYYYTSLFQTLMAGNIPFYLKFYNNDSFYPLYTINSVGDTSFDVSFPKTEQKVAISDGNINYVDIQGIEFREKNKSRNK